LQILLAKNNPGAALQSAAFQAPILSFMVKIIFSGP
jgi:hypothetical protein